ncbi:MAG: histidine triad nucleotide-binding protein [Bacteriovoracaceae bacterium]|nr:histidine triad nucleotide-binding protein [Bacteriovoracaceae bacterium]
MSDCLFCKIVKGEIPSQKVYEDETVLAFKDIKPSAKEHYLFISKTHTKNVNEMSKNEPQSIVEVHNAIREFTQKEGLEETGFRVVTNVNKHSGQIVFHTHFHVLGGEQLRGFGA